MVKDEVVDGFYRQHFAHRCVWKDILPVVSALADLYNYYKDGFLMRPGGLDDQPGWYIEAMRLFSGCMNAAERKRNKDLENNARSHS